MKYLGINLTQEVTVLYTENDKALIKETEEDTHIWNNISCLWVRKINIVKYPYCAKSSIDSMQYLAKFQSHFLYRTRKNFLTLI